MFQNPSKTKAKQNVNRVSNEIQSDTPCWRRDHTIKDNTDPYYESLWI